MSDADDLLHGDDHTEYEVRPEAATVEQASESMRRVKYYERKLAELKAPFAAEQQRLIERELEVTLPIEKKIAWHREALEAFHRAALAAKRVPPTMKLPHGDSLLKARKPAIEIIDEAELLTWAKGEGLDIVPDPKPETVAKSKLNKLAKLGDYEDLEPGSEVLVGTSDGEQIPGVRATVKAAAFSIIEHREKGE